MIVKIKKPGFIPNSKTVTFGYNEIEFEDIFGRVKHELHFYPSGNINEYLVCIDEIKRDSKIGSLLVLDMAKPGVQDLLKKALKYDYKLDESEYEIMI